ncbi:MAG TPA: hypothetical protein VFL61_01595 [Gaiellaceae bacterium]|nr:hypothetical protein [Gaiellaceae bacterium]
MIRNETKAESKTLKERSELEETELSSDATEVRSGQSAVVELE